MIRRDEQLLKSIMAHMGPLLDARFKTYHVIITAEIKASEDRIRKDMATKDDIKNMATKDDIKNMATKDDIKNMATKDDLKNLEERLTTKMATKQDITRLELKFETTQNQVIGLAIRLKSLEKNRNSN